MAKEDDQFMDMVEKSVYRQQAIRGPAPDDNDAALPPANAPAPAAPPPPGDDQFLNMVEKSVYRQQAIKIPPSATAAAASAALGKAGPLVPPAKPPSEDQFDEMVEKSVYRQKAIKAGDGPPPGMAPAAAKPAAKATAGRPKPAAANWMLPVAIGLGVLVALLVVVWRLTAANN